MLDTAKQPFAASLTDGFTIFLSLAQIRGNVNIIAAQFGQSKRICSGSRIP